MLTFCKDCVYCRREPMQGTVPVQYVFKCHRRPPTFLLLGDGYSAAGFPKVSETDCCGEGEAVRSVGSVPIDAATAELKATLGRE